MRSEAVHLKLLHRFSLSPERLGGCSEQGEENRKVEAKLKCGNNFKCSRSESWSIDTGVLRGMWRA